MTPQIASQKRESRYRWIGAIVVILALLGWFLALYFWSGRTAAETALASQIALTDEVTALEARIVALDAEAASAQSGRDVVVGELDQLNRDRATAQAGVAALEVEADRLTALRDALETELVAGRDEQAALEIGIAEAQQTVADTSQELSDVGARLEEGRLREVELQTNLAALSTAVADLTATSSDAEMRLQAAREAEASLEQEVLTARQVVEDLGNQRLAMEQVVATLEQRQEQLVTDNSTTEEQMTAMQSVVVDLTRTLADRSAHLATLETRIADLQQSAGDPARATAAGIVLGARYVFGDVSASFAPDNSFRMENDAGGQAVVGTYALADGVLTLTDVEGDLGRATFPMRCGIVADAGRFTLTDEDGTCAPLADVTFEHSE